MFAVSEPDNEPSLNGEFHTSDINIQDNIPSLGFVMACLNINGLLTHIDELRVFICDKHIDILAINETKLDGSVSDNQVFLQGFNDPIRNDRSVNGRYGGGVCIYIRSGLNFKRRPDLLHDKLELMSVEISNPHSRPFVISTWYRPQRTPWPVPELFQSFEEIITKVDALNIEFYLLGDINANLLPGFLDHESRMLLNILDTFGLSQLITKPTRVTRNSKSLIDLCITNCPEKVAHSDVIPLGISDHSFVYMSRKIHYSSKGCSKVITKRSLKNFESERFISDLRLQDWKDTGLVTDPNEMWNIWKSRFLSCLDTHAPLRKKRIGNRRCPWITNDLLIKMHKRDSLKKKAEKTKDKLIWNKFKQVRNSVNNSIKTAKRHYFTSNLAKSKGDMRKSWKLINELRSRQYKSTDIPELKIGDERITSDIEKAETFNSYFTSIGARLSSEIPPVNIEPEAFMKPTDKSFSFRKILESEVHEIIRKLDNSKATGLDKIPCGILKTAADVVVPSLTLIFNQSIATGIFPKEWQSARVIPIFKKGANSDLENYRPISILPVVAKVFEKVVYNQFYEYLNRNNLLTDCQSGFRSLHSTLSALLKASNNWSVNIDNGLINGVIFIDLKKAFDTIDHGIILRKLSYYGVDQVALNWFSSYLGNRVQKCQVNGHLSSSSVINCGVPQGSIIGPLLFLLYINDLPNCLTIAEPNMYADDTNLTVSADNLADLKHKMNLELANINQWLRVNKLSLNITKTEYMVIGSRQRLRAITDGQSIELSIEGKEISRVKEAKSLGMVIDDSLSWNKHAEETCKKISCGIGMLKRLRPFINQSTAVDIYKSLIEPHFDYCSGVWYGTSKTMCDRLQKLQNRAARVITKSDIDKSATSLRKLLNWDDVDSRRKKQLAISMYKSIHGLCPSYIKDMFVSRSLVHDLRNMKHKLSLPKPRTDYLKKSFSYCGAEVWNSLPPEIRGAKSLSLFKKKINQHLI